MTMNCFMVKLTAILFYPFLRQRDDLINLGIHLQNPNGQTNVIEISLISEGVVYAYSQGLVRKAHGNKFDECKGLPSVLFVRTVIVAHIYNGGPCV
jgi:hypothetical protein